MKSNPLVHSIFTIFFCITAALLTPVRGSGQNTPDTVRRNIELDPLVVTAERNPVTYSKLMRVVTVISREEIERMPATSLNEVLEFALSTDIRSRGSHGIQADVSMRGGSFDQTLVLLNGVNISDPQTGHHNLNLPMDLSAIDRIEILSGPAARVFGPNAFNGVINIITSLPETAKLSLGGLAGQHGLYRWNAGIGLPGKKSRHQLDISQSASDGFTENTDFKTINLYSNNSLLVGKSSLVLQAGFNSKAFGANSFYTPKYPEQFEATRTLFVSMKLDNGQRWISPVIYWRRHYDRFELFRNQAPAWYTNHNYHQTNVFGSNANKILFQGTAARTTLGYDLRYESIISNKLGDSLDTPRPVSGEEGISYHLGKNRMIASMFAEQTFYAGNFSLSGGLLASYYPSENQKLALFPGLDAGYNITDQLRIYLSANRTLRMPTFTDLYYRDAVSIGNPGLKPEEAFVVEAGVKYRRDGISFHTGLFRRYGRNMIDWVKPLDEESWHAMNLTRVTVSGIECSASVNFEQFLNQRCFLHSVSLGYSYLQADKSSEDYLSKYVLDILKHKADLGISHRVWKMLSASWNLSYQDRVGGYIRYQDGVADTHETAYEPFLLVDVRLLAKFKRVELFSEASNLLNSEAIDFGNIPQPGRWIRLGFKLNFSRERI